MFCRYFINLGKAYHGHEALVATCASFWLLGTSGLVWFSAWFHHTRLDQIAIIVTALTSLNFLLLTIGAEYGVPSHDLTPLPPISTHKHTESTPALFVLPS